MHRAKQSEVQKILRGVPPTPPDPRRDPRLLQDDHFPIPPQLTQQQMDVPLSPSAALKAALAQSHADPRLMGGAVQPQPGGGMPGGGITPHANTSLLLPPQTQYSSSPTHAASRGVRTSTDQSFNSGWPPAVGKLPPLSSPSAQPAGSWQIPAVRVVIPPATPPSPSHTSPGPVPPLLMSSGPVPQALSPIHHHGSSQHSFSALGSHAQLLGSFPVIPLSEALEERLALLEGRALAAEAASSEANR